MISMRFISSAFVNGPWLLVGDFNCVLGCSWRKGWGPSQDCFLFWFPRDVFSYDSLHLPTKGLPYTWTNRRGTRNQVEIRLDLCLCNFQSIDAYMVFVEMFHFTPYISSDHCPLLVSFSKVTLITLKTPFWFHSMWLDHPYFLSLVDVWMSSKFRGCPLYVLAAKLHVLKPRIKVLEYGS